MNIEIANRLVELRRDRGMSQEELAARMGVSRQAVSKWERAESSPDTDNLIALADIYGISLDMLLLGRPSIQIAGEMEQEGEQRANRRRLMAFPYPIFLVLAYLLMGVWWHWWHPGWIIFLTIPLYYWYAAHQ